MATITSPKLFRAGSLTSGLAKIVFFLFLFSYFTYIVVSHAPATWTVWALQQAFPGFWASGIEGSLWRGKAKSSQLDIGSKDPVALGELKWVLNPWSLLVLNPCLNVSTALPGQTLLGNACHSVLTGSTKLDGVEINAPLNLFEELLTAPAVGSVSLSIANAKFDGELNISALDGRMNVQGVRINAGPEWVDVGTLGANLSPTTDGNVRAEVFDIDSPFKSELNVTWGRSTEFKAIGNIAPQPTVPDFVRQGLQIFGEDLGGGVYRVQFP